jgi:hypothetical protein
MTLYVGTFLEQELARIYTMTKQFPVTKTNGSKVRKKNK